MNLEQFIRETYNSESEFQMRPYIVCSDGFTMSVQASAFHYCQPRITTDTYYALEIGFPTEKEDLIMEYAEQPIEPTNTVYGYVPATLIQEVIEKHGGINTEETFKVKTDETI